MVSQILYFVVMLFVVNKLQIFESYLLTLTYFVVMLFVVNKLQIFECYIQICHSLSKNADLIENVGHNFVFRNF